MSEIVGAGHINYQTTLDAVLVAHIKTNTFFNIKLLESLMVLEGKAEHIPECDLVLVVGIKKKIGVNDSSGYVLNYCVAGSSDLRHGPIYLGGENLCRGWLQRRWRGLSAYLVRQHFTIADMARNFRVDTDDPRRTGGERKVV